MADNTELVFTATQDDFATSVVAKSQDTPVVVDFWAPWCAPCRALAPLLERLVSERKGEVVLAKVNADEEQELAARYGINVLPTVLAFRGGKPVLSFEGVLPEAQLVDFLNQIVPSQADREASAAAALETTNPAQAEKIYRQVLQGDANQQDALLGLARVLVAGRQDGEAAELLDRVLGHGEHGTETERLSAILWVRHQAQVLGDEAGLRERLEIDPANPQLLYELGAVLAAQDKSEEALEVLLRAAQADKKLAAGKVRETMVKIFHVVGARSPLADGYRDKLSSLLY